MPPKAKPVELSKRTGIDYNTELQRIVASVKSDINKELLPLLRREQSQYVMDSPLLESIKRILAILRQKYDSMNQRYDLLATSFVDQANRVNRKRFNTAMKSFGIDIFGDSPELVSYLEASVYDNVQLIKSIPDVYLNRVESIIMTGIRSGARSSYIAKSLTKQFGIEAKRAKFIARDQTEKINGELNAKRQAASGFKYFKWLTSKDQRVRERHRIIANKVTAYGEGIYRWNHPPIGDEKIPIIPGQAPNCRCVALAVPDWEVKENQDEKKVKEGVYR